MSSATDAQALLERLDSTRPNNTGIRAIAKEQGKNAGLAAQLWKSGGFSARMLEFVSRNRSGSRCAWMLLREGCAPAGPRTRRGRTGAAEMRRGR